MPGVHPGTDRGRVVATLEVDGEVFVLRRGEDGGTQYDWTSGRNPGYGFGSSASPDRPEEEHRRSIRDFSA